MPQPDSAEALLPSTLSPSLTRLHAPLQPHPYLQVSQKWVPFLNWLISFRCKARGGKCQYLRDQPLLQGPEKIIWGLAAMHGNVYLFFFFLIIIFVCVKEDFLCLLVDWHSLTASDYLQTTAGKSCRLSNCKVWEKRKQWTSVSKSRIAIPSLSASCSPHIQLYFEKRRCSKGRSSMICSCYVFMQQSPNHLTGLG